MKNYNCFFWFLLFMAIIGISSSSCNKPDVPVVQTSEITSVTKTYAVTGGAVLDENGADVTDKGICWSTAENPETTDNVSSCCSGAGSFTIIIKDLSPATKYFARAYATNSAGTGYGDPISFTTGEITLPELLTTSVTNIDLVTARCEGYIFNDGASRVTESGMCWSLSHSPTILDNHTTDNTDSRPYFITCIIPNLEPGTTYYVRAFATNAAGTSYGSELRFSTLSENPPFFNPDKIYGSITDIDGNIYRTIQLGNRAWMAENLKAERLNDGTRISLYSAWNGGASPAMCWFNDDPGLYKDIYGGFYNIHAVTSGRLCPAGWHIPGRNDWIELISFLGNSGSAGGKMKETGTMNWMNPNYGATNESGLTCLPGGYRSYEFILRGSASYLWSSTPNNIYSGIYYDSYVLDYRYKSIRTVIMTDNRNGLNVRCVMD